MTKRTTKAERVQTLVQRIRELTYEMAKADQAAAQVRNELSELNQQLDKELGGK